MNLIDGEMSAGKFQADYVEMHGVSGSDAGVTLGFRAEDAGISNEGGQINAPIYTMELLGDATMVSVRTGGELVAVKAGKSFKGEIGGPVSTTVPSVHCHQFDTTTGTRVGD